MTERPDLRDTEPGAELAEVDAVVVGAGFSGLYTLYRLRSLGLSVEGFEAGRDVGGTWYWNRYPGARCDVESLNYSYSFSEELEQEWEWSERYATQPEILRYLEHVAQRFDLRRHITFNTRVSSATFMEEERAWQITTERGHALIAQFLVMATGCLSAAKKPEIPGLDRFRGRWYHTGNWPPDGVDFSRHRVGIIGTGSSGIQCIPLVAEQAGHLTVFQRTPSFSLPARNGPLDPDVQAAHKADYRSLRRLARESPVGISRAEPDKRAADATPEEREATYEMEWRNSSVIAFTHAYTDISTDQAANDTAADFVRGKIRQLVRDPGLAETLTPKGYPLGTKRTCLDTNYYQTFNRDNVILVDVRKSPIEYITPGGVRTVDTEYELDTIIFATGYDAMTGPLLAVAISGRAGRTLSEKWTDGPRSLLGIQTAGFPNLFIITGPGSPSVLSNMVVSIEQHVEWIADCIEHLRRRKLRTVEATEAAEEVWVQHVREEGDATLYPRANSWYMGDNIPEKPRVLLPYVGGVGAYRAICDDVAGRGYDGFCLS